jgi:hypothetical protein
MDNDKQRLIDMLDGCDHPGGHILMLQILNTQNPRKYIDVIERLTKKTFERPHQREPQQQIMHDQILSSFIEPLMARIIQSQISSFISEPEPEPEREQPTEKKSIKYGSIIREKACCICSTDFTEKDDVVIRKCEHMFHEDCLSEWENGDSPNAKKCPICRSN